MQLQPIHESAIDLLVAGKRQCDVAKELNVSARTLRRWSADDTFVNELKQQHEFARRLEQEESQQLRRQHRALQQQALQQIQTYLSDPQTPLELKKHCLTLSLRATHFDIAQEWRQFVYFDRKQEKAEQAQARREDKVTIAQASHRLEASTSLLERLQKQNPAAFAAAFGLAPVPAASSRPEPNGATAVRPREPRETGRSTVPATQPTADKTGRANGATAVRPPEPHESGRSSVRAARPKADKCGHTASQEPHPLLDAICAEVARESFGRSPLSNDLRQTKRPSNAA